MVLSVWYTVSRVFAVVCRVSYACTRVLSLERPCRSVRVPTELNLPRNRGTQL